ncbi:hypothetical protein BHE74_00055155, partial [Ensete ventricosum]
PLLAALCAVVIAAPAKAAGLTAGGSHPLRPGAGGRPLRAGRWWPPLACTDLQPALLREPRYGRLPPLRVGRNQQCPQAPPLRAGLGRGLAWVADPTWGLTAPPSHFLHCENIVRTRRLYIPVVQIWMEKMKEVKCPPL